MILRAVIVHILIPEWNGHNHSKQAQNRFTANQGIQMDFANMHYLFGCMDEMIDIV
jgi:hypothetical protein